MLGIKKSHTLSMEHARRKSGRNEFRNSFVFEFKNSLSRVSVWRLRVCNVGVVCHKSFSQLALEMPLLSSFNNCRTLIYRQLLSFVFSRNGQLHCMVYLNVLSTCYYACLFKARVSLWLDRYMFDNIMSQSWTDDTS